MNDAKNKGNGGEPEPDPSPTEHGGYLDGRALSDFFEEIRPIIERYESRGLNVFVMAGYYDIFEKVSERTWEIWGDTNAARGMAHEYLFRES